MEEVTEDNITAIRPGTLIFSVQTEPFAQITIYFAVKSVKCRSSQTMVLTPDGRLSLLFLQLFVILSRQHLQRSARYFFMNLVM